MDRAPWAWAARHRRFLSRQVLPPVRGQQLLSENPTLWSHHTRTHEGGRQLARGGSTLAAFQGFHDEMY